MEPEFKIQNKILSYLKKLGANAWTVKTVSSNKRGVPDILCCYRGRFVAIEVKAKYGRLGKLQKYNIDKINKANGYAIVAYDVETVKELIAKIDDKLLGDCK